MKKQHRHHFRIESFNIFRVTPTNEALGGTDRVIMAPPSTRSVEGVTDPCQRRFGSTACTWSQRCQEVRNNIAGPLTFSVAPCRLTTTESDTSE